MKPESIEAYKKLEENLVGLVKIYRHLLQIVRKEREILVSADLNELNENNRSKEAMLIKAREVEQLRMNAALELANSEGLSPNARLLDFARHIGSQPGDRLRQLHTVLDLLLKRVKEHNSHNEVLVGSALDSITGAIGSIRDTLKEKPTYKRTGDIATRPTDAGQLVRKEA